MILYFSGTGNSRFTAELIGSELKDEVISLNDLIKQEDYRVFESEKPYVIVAPVYAWQLPRIVRDYIRRCRFMGNRQMYFVLTCGSNLGNAQQYAKQLTEKLGMEYKGMAEIVMPENYITMFKAPSPKAGRRIIKKAEKKIVSTAHIIRDGGMLNYSSPKAKLLSSVVNVTFYKFFMGDKKFAVTQNCNGCGLCAKKCPVNNIELSGDKPMWQGNCTQCMACICGCPKEAIEYGKSTQGKYRYTFEKCMKIDK